MKKKEYIIRTDLAIQNRNLKKISSRKINGIEIKEMIKDKYIFTDIIFQNIETKYSQNKIMNILIKELKKYLNKYKLNKNKSCLVVGLGNEKIASDSLGPLTIKNVIATSYIENLNINQIYRKVYTYIPRIMKDTGIMPFKGIRALIKEIKPDFIIVIDSLISDKIKYLNKVIQITDIGITPGSGISNYGEEVSMNTLEIPVIVIGVPTAIEASSIMKDVLNIKENKLSFKEGYDLIFSCKDIDLTISELSKIIGDGINKSLNNISIF